MASNPLRPEEEEKKKLQLLCQTLGGGNQSEAKLPAPPPAPGRGILQAGASVTPSVCGGPGGPSDPCTLQLPARTRSLPALLLRLCSLLLVF